VSIEQVVGILGKSIIELDVQFCAFLYVVFFQRVHKLAFVCYV
jgi:hypothetical protein